MSLIFFAFCGYLWSNYLPEGGFYHLIDVWKFGSVYVFLGFDAISLSFIVLTTFLIPFCIFFGYKAAVGLSQYSSLILLLGIILIYIFSVLDVFMFYILFESILVPLFILIGLFGSRSRKLHSAVLLFGYTVIGSFVMIISLLLFYLVVGSFFYFELWSFEFSSMLELVLFVLLFFSFSIKVPLFPFHIWLPEAHVEASTEGSVILAGVLLKLGGYAMLRFLIPIFSVSCIYFLPLVYLFCILGMFYVCLMTLRQVDLKRLIAYSSVGHMSLVVVGLVSNNIYSLDGSMYVMLCHGLVSGALFFSVGYMYERYKTRQLHYFYDLVQTMPIFSTCFFIYILGNIAFPGLFSFIGELYLCLGILSTSMTSLMLSLPSLFLTTVYTICLYSRIIFGYSGAVQSIWKVHTDFNYLDFLFFFPFVFLVGFFGIFSPELLILV